MVSNKVFLLLPLTTSGDSLEEAYLKVVPEWPEDLLYALCCQVKSSLDLNNHESYDKFFDQKHYLAIRSLIGKQEKKKNSRPSLVNLLDSTFKDFVDFRHNEDSNDNQSVKLNNIRIDKSLICAYAYTADKDFVTLADCDALNISKDKIEILGKNDEKISASIIDFTAKDLYQWFTVHREPSRLYDSNYKKHGKQDQWSKSGVKISRMTYKASEAQRILHKAVGAPNDKKNLFFFDKSKNMMLVFWDEGLPQPKYHGYEVPYDNAVIQKIYAKGSSSLKKKIDMVAEW